MPELQQLNLATLYANAEAVKGARTQNRLAELMRPFQVQQAQQQVETGQGAAADAQLKRQAAAAKTALGIMGDLSGATPEEAQAKFSQARQTVADLGIDVSKIPEKFSPEIYSGIKAMADTYGASEPTKYQFGGDLVSVDPSGQQFLVTTKKDPVTGNIVAVRTPIDGGKLASKTGLTPEQQAQLDIQTAGGKKGAEIGAEVSAAPRVAEAQAQIEGAKTKAKVEAENAASFAASFQKKAQGAQNVLQSLDAADELLDKATGSYAGNFVDEVGKFVGRSTEGAQAIAGLKIVQADLMLGMPRMEGPQSDRDVQLYREAAASIGDPNVPADTKRAAVRTIRKLQERYSKPSAPAIDDNHVNSLLEKYK